MNHRSLTCDYFIWPCDNFSMAETTVRKENHALRTVTAVLMLFIAIVHYDSCMTVLGFSVHNIVKNIGRFAIPVFVLISGYYCYSKDGHAEARIKQKALHIVYLIIFYKIFYLIFTGSFVVAGVIPFENLVYEFLIVTPAYYVETYNGLHDMSYTQSIWFLYALLLMYIFWYILYRFKIDFKYSWYLAIPVLVACLLMGEFLPMFGIYWIGDFNIIDSIASTMYPFVAIPFFVFGYFLHKHKEWFDERFSNRDIWMILFFGTALMCVEAALVANSKILYLGSVIVAVFLFMGTFRVPEDRGRFPILEYMGRHMTVWIYVYFGATTFLIRYLMQPHCHEYFLCEVVGPAVALLLTVEMAYFTALILMRKKRTKVEKKSNDPVTSN